MMCHDDEGMQVPTVKVGCFEDVQCHLLSHFRTLE